MYQQAAADDGRVYDYLARSRGVAVADAMRYYRFGYVAEPVDGHEKYVGRMAIPYVTPAGVIDLRFRCIEPHDCKTECNSKYLGLPGSKPTLFNVRSLRIETVGLAICEGELDAVAVEQECHVPAVGYPGVSTWRKNPFWRRIFPGFQTVWIVADGDEPGREAAAEIHAELPNSRIVSMPDGHDATSFIQAYGREAMMEKLGIANG